MLCELCNEEEAFMTLIPTGAEGLPQSVGPACFARMGLDLAKNVLPAEEIAATLGPMFVAPAREDLHEEAAVERKKRSRKKAPETQADEGQAGGAAETPATGTDE